MAIKYVIVLFSYFFHVWNAFSSRALCSLEPTVLIEAILKHLAGYFLCILNTLYVYIARRLKFFSK